MQVTAVEGDIHGLKLRLVDTPGLEAAAGSARYNTWALKQIDKARRKYKPDLVLYCERLDMVTLSPPQPPPPEMLQFWH